MKTSDSYLVDVVVPFADRMHNLEPLKSWLSKESVPINFRIILVHDVNSQDTASEEVSKLLSPLDPNSYIYVKGKFGSPGGARNAGLEKVRAQWVCFWDSDDFPLPNEFLNMIESAIQSQSEVCVGKFETIQHHRNEQKSCPQSTSRVSVAITPGFWRMAFTRHSIGDVRFTNSRMGEDQLFLLAINFGSLSWYQHKEVVYRYVVGFDSQLTNSESSYFDLLETFDNSIEFCGRKTDFRAAYIYSIMQIRMAITICLKFPLEKTGRSILNYTRSLISSPKNLVLATIPALLTVVFNYLVTIVGLAKVKYRGRSAQL
jgi:glycosyltransferase involved in cell wall biosynthesis